MSIDPQEEVYIEFLNYDWDSFQDFQDGLSEILENHLESLKEQDPSVTMIPPTDKQQLIDQAKCFFYCSQSGNILSLLDYYEWKSKYGDKYDKNKKIVEITDELEPENTTSAFSSANINIDANINKNTDTNTDTDTDTNANSNSNSENPPYSSNYQELVDLIMSGKPVPGINQIDDTVLTEKISQSTVSQRRKPWEK